MRLQKTVGAERIKGIGLLAVDDLLRQQFSGDGCQCDAVSLMARCHVEAFQAIHSADDGQAIRGIRTKTREGTDDAYVFQRREKPYRSL